MGNKVRSFELLCSRFGAAELKYNSENIAGKERDLIVEIILHTFVI